MTTVSDVTSAIGSLCTNVSSAVTSAATSIASTISSIYNATIGGLSTVASKTSSAVQSAYKWTASTYSDNKKVANFALGSIAAVGVAIAGYTQRTQITAAVVAAGNLITRK